MRISRNVTGLPVRMISPEVDLRRALKRLTRAEVTAFAIRADVPAAQARRFLSDQPVSANTVMRMLMAQGNDPADGSLRAPGRCPEILWGSLGIALHVARADRPLRDVADEAKVSATAVFRTERGDPVSFKTFWRLCIWMRRHPLDFVSVEVSRETLAGAAA